VIDSLQSGFERVGGMLLAPVETLRDVALARRGGFAEAATLAVVMAVLTAAPDLTFAARSIEPLGGQVAASMALRAVASGLTVPGLMTFVGAMLLTVLARRRQGEEKQEARDLDLAAMCAVPFIVARGLAALLLIVPGWALDRPLDLAGLCGSLVSLGLAVKQVRS
jgi:hypothetical protein